MSLLCKFSFCFSADSIVEGRGLVTNPKKGNCIACHKIPLDDRIFTLANIGPPLIKLKERFSIKELTDYIWDPTIIYPETIMPPYGKNNLIDSHEIKAIIDYLYEY